MAVSATPFDRQRREPPPMVLGGFAALAESAWMGIAQASEFLEPARLAWPRIQAEFKRLTRIQLKGLLTRELTITEATVVLMASFLISAVLGAVRQVLFNAQFGVGLEANAYYAAFRLPDTLFSLIAGGALSSAMIPVLLSTSAEAGQAAGWRLTSLVLNVLLAVFAGIVIIGEIFAPVFVTHILAPGFDAETSRLTVTLTRLMLIQPMVLAVGSVATAVLNSQNRFALTALSVASHNVSLITGILAARFIPGLGIYGPTLGVIGGAALQALILVPGLFGRGFRYQPVWDLRDVRLREVIRLLIPNGLSVGVGYAGFILDTAFASQAPEAAGLPAIHNAWLLAGLPIALLGQAVGQSAFPRIAVHAANLEWSRMRRTVLGALLAAVALSIPALLGLIFLGRPVIQLLFERGKFDAAAGSLTYSILTAYVVALPAYVGTEVVTRGLIALRDTRTPLATNSVQLAGRALMMTALIGSLGVVAIPISLAVTASVETILLLTVLLFKVRNRMHGSASSKFQTSQRLA
jgi:putative peptidoglycan lipid II flippase